MRGTRTMYQGVLFRSLIERAWAEWFDGDGFHWLYEPVRFRDPKAPEGKGYTYTPDFQIGNIFIECKPLDSTHFNNWHYCTAPLLIIFGKPDRFHIRLHTQAHGVIRGHYLSFQSAYTAAGLL